MQHYLDLDKCRKLKEIGFPQKDTEHAYHWIEAHQDYDLDNGDTTNFIACPTLSELIDWLGDDFSILDRKRSETFTAISNWPDEGGRKYGDGTTPLDAVCNLALAIKGNNHG